MIMINFFSLIV